MSRVNPAISGDLQDRYRARLSNAAYNENLAMKRYADIASVNNKADRVRDALSHEPQSEAAIRQRADCSSNVARTTLLALVEKGLVERRLVLAAGRKQYLYALCKGVRL